MKPYRALIFDLGGVIVGLDFAQGYERISQLCGLPAREIPQRIRATGLVPQFECGALGAEEFIHQLTKAFDGKLSREDFVEIWSSIFRPEPLLPESFFDALKQRYRLVLLSNTNSLHFEVLEARYPLLRGFDAKVLSYRVGAAKPDARIYQAALEAAGCRPEECFFTDDVLLYVEGARAAGIDAELFTDFANLQAALKQRGIRWEES
ncbi:MAG: HAD family phosphatase [Bryobacteraceae bacterium]|nr:HAD family phosphatase [Bryobacteraceae bacterium]MDW8380349.1 HAD family phosphatase [Bryobacterales bacterium]